MSIATYDDVVELLGDLDDMFIERIIDSGASPAEISEALEDLEYEHRFGEESRHDASPRVAAVRAILEELLADEDDDAAIPTPGPSLLAGEQ